MPVVRVDFDEVSYPQHNNGKGSNRALYTSDGIQPGQPMTNSGRISPSESRGSLIVRKKREQRQQWLNDVASPFGVNQLDTTPGRLSPRDLQQSPLSNNFQSIAPKNDNVSSTAPLEHPSTIERPRSALHRGDFGKPAQQPVSVSPPRPVLRSTVPQASSLFSTSPTSPWFTTQINTSQYGSLFTPSTAYPIEGALRARSASYAPRSLSFELKPPTSPLAVESRNDDSDFGALSRPTSPEKMQRRHTFSPQQFQRTQLSVLNSDSSHTTPRRPPSLRSERSQPYQAHQPRRSVSSLSEASHPLSFPSTPTARSRRPSLASESSPLQRLPMVGRYEESILRGRMSSLPSKPLDFVAHVGVLGRGKCKNSLRCPPHLAVPFVAVFYNYGSRPTSPMSGEGPSPYVGMVDLDTYFRKPQSRDPSCSASPRDVQHDLHEQSPQHERSAADRSNTHKEPANGGYRIPQQGQLQIIIKNPHKTAVKLFLIPYDLTGMKPGQKTFIRQRSYSAGPIIDMPLDARSNLGTDRPEASLSCSDDPRDRPVLRYLIHLNICSPSRGRFYLYKNIRVVFANRVPDGTEKLRQEIQLPEPRFSPYKPDREPGTPDRHTNSGISPSPSSRWDLGLPITSPWNSQSPSRVLDYPQNASSPGVQSPGWDGIRSLQPAYPSLETTSTRQPVHEFSNSEWQQMGGQNLSAWRHPWPRVTKEQIALGQSAFARLPPDATGNFGASGRPQSPQPGEGLLTLQFRNSLDGQEFLR